MLINFITLFPEKIKAYFAEGLQARAIEKGVFSFNTVNLRDFGDKWGRVDDTVYGGGAGMLLKPEPIHKALDSLGDKKGTVIYPSASGKLFNESKAYEFSSKSILTFISGYYEGIDHRVVENLVDEELRLGNFVLSSGDLPSLCIADAVFRLLPGFMGDSLGSLKDESHNIEGVLEYPQYTKPSIYHGWEVPEVLLNGNHAEIKKWNESHRKNSQ